MSSDKTPPLCSWETLATNYPFKTRWFVVRQDWVRTHSGETIRYSYHEHPGCVLVVAVTTSKEVVLLRHYRYPVRQWCWEVPAGRLRDGVEGLIVAQHELHEEAGGWSNSWQYVNSFFTSTGSSTERAEVYFASNVQVNSNQLEPTELLEVVVVPWKVALQMATEGKISDGPSALALLMCQPHLISTE